jgi:hypothetical protein
MQCPTCGLRYSIYPPGVAAALRTPGIRDHLRVRLVEAVAPFDLRATEEIHSTPPDAGVAPLTLDPDPLDFLPVAVADLIDRAEAASRVLAPVQVRPRRTTPP